MSLRQIANPWPARRPVLDVRSSRPVMSPQLVIMIDWSASSTRGPVKESPDRCWFAWARVGQTVRPGPVYCRTRGECMDRVEAQLRGHAGGALVGFDFPIGYPRAEDARPVLPEGRALVEYVAARIDDRPDATNNRFIVAAGLNQKIRQRTGHVHGPFWGVPATQAAADITVKKPRETGIAEYRPVERLLRDRKRNIQSAWKLLGVGSVGSQALLGLPAVARVLRLAGPRGRLWPFEPIDRDDAIVVAEIWPTLGDFSGSRYPGVLVKDARQVLAMRDAALDAPEHLLADLLAPPVDPSGWILGAPR